MRKTSWIRSALLVLLAMLMIFAVISCAKQEMPNDQPNNETPKNEQTTNETPKNEQTTNETPKEVEKKGAWESATYLTDKEFGTGAKTLKVTVKADDQSIVFTIHSDKETVADALLEFQLVAGDDSQYGLYVKTVNGMLADYDVDGTYWGFFKGGEMMNTGVSATNFNDGDSFELVKTK